MSKASLRISETLHVSTVLREVVESARAMTGARYGVITAIDEAGAQEWATAGLTPGEQGRMMDWASREQLFAHLRDLQRPLRLRDVPRYFRSLGFSEHAIPAKTMLGAEMRLRDVHIGGFYVAEKADGQEFTREDEGTLMLFASQAAATVANAREHRHVQRARADLEALVDTSPVGVVVFDARSGKVVSFNREAGRIASALCKPGEAPEQVVDVLNVRYTDGRRVVDEETPMAEALRGARNVRAEEVVLQVPDGRSVTVLVNATAILSEEGKVESMVVTLQDLTPREETERLRGEFLGLVSHELRAPLAAIKGCAATVLDSSPTLAPAEAAQFWRIVDQQADHMHELISELLDAARIEAGTLSVAPEPTQVAAIVDQARNTFVSGGGRNPVRIDVPLDLPQVLADSDRIVQVLGNLLSNAARHSPDSATIAVAAKQDGVHVAVSVTDAGRGIDVDLLPHLFRKFGRSGRERGRGIGAGLGLAICKGLVEAHGGRIWAENADDGVGTRFTFTIPAANETKGEPGLALRPQHAGARPARMNVLFVDDDPQALVYVRRVLGEAGYGVVVTGDAEEVPGLIDTGKPDLVLLDLLLQGTDGIELMERIPALSDRPVIFLSAYGRDETIARALELGAADYILKPFSPTELLARIQAVLRRNAPSRLYQAGALVIDHQERRVSLAGQQVALTATEYDLLSQLSLEAGSVLTHEVLLRRVWGSRNSGDTRLIRAFIRKLRQKLGDDAGCPSYIFTEPRVGYRLAKPDSS